MFSIFRSAERATLDAWSNRIAERIGELDAREKALATREAKVALREVELEARDSKDEWDELYEKLRFIDPKWGEWALTYRAMGSNLADAKATARKHISKLYAAFD